MKNNVETISFDEMSTLDVPSAALRSSLDKIASALQKVGTAGTDASAAVDELRASLRAAAAQSVKSARSLAKFDEINHRENHRCSEENKRLRPKKQQPLRQ